jgi:hypothetical protein
MQGVLELQTGAWVVPQVSPYGSSIGEGGNAVVLGRMRSEWRVAHQEPLEIGYQMPRRILFVPKSSVALNPLKPE